MTSGELRSTLTLQIRKGLPPAGWAGETIAFLVAAGTIWGFIAFAVSTAPVIAGFLVRLVAALPGGLRAFRRPRGRGAGCRPWPPASAGPR